MEVHLSSRFFERLRNVDPAHAHLVTAQPCVLLVSPLGTTVEEIIAASWAKGTFRSPVDSLEYHFTKHARGRSRQQYTLAALRFFSEHQGDAQWGRWNPSWPEAFRIKIGGRGGYFTPGGRILSYWDDYGNSEKPV